MMTVEGASEKAMGVNIVGVDDVGGVVAIKGCDGAEIGGGSATTTSTGTLATTTSVCFTSGSATMQQFVDRLAAAGGDSVVRDNAKDGFVISTATKVLDDVGERFHSSTMLSVVADGKVNHGLIDKQRPPEDIGPESTAGCSGGYKQPAAMDGVQDNATTSADETNALMEDVIDGFAFASFARYEDLEEWVQREEKLKQLQLQLSDSNTVDDGVAKKTSRPATATPEVATTPKRKCKRNKENKMATLALTVKDMDTLNGGASSAAVKQFDSTSSIFASGSGSGNNDKKAPSDFSQRSPRSSMVSIVDCGRSSPSLLRPKSSSAALDSALFVAGQSAGSSITSARVKRSPNNGSASGDRATDLSVPLPPKVPKRETLDTVPGVARGLQEHQQSQMRSSSPPRARSNASETSDSAKRASGSSSTTVNNRRVQNQSQLIAASLSKALSPPYIAGNLSSSDKVLNRVSTDTAPNSVISGSATPLIAALNQPLSTKSSLASDTPSSHLSSKPNVGGLISHVSEALFPAFGAGLFTTPGTALGAPTYFHTEMHNHQHTHMHQYPPFLSPFLSAAAAGLPGVPGMVTPSYGSIPGFPITSQVSTVPPLPSQVSNPSAQVSAKVRKKGKWCAMHVQIAWDIYNKTTALRRDKKPDDGGRASIASISSATLPTTSAHSAASGGGSLSTGMALGQTAVRQSAVSMVNAPVQAQAMTAANNAVPDRSNSHLNSDSSREQRRRDKEKQRSNSTHRPGEAETINRISSSQNGMQPPSLAGGHAGMKLPIEQRYNNGHANVGLRASSAVAPSHSSTLLPLKSEQSTSTPLFQDGLLSRQQQGYALGHAAGSTVSSTHASTTANALSTATADGLLRNAAAAMGIRHAMPPLPSGVSNFNSSMAFGNNAASNLALAANLAAIGQALPGSSTLDAAYRTLLGLDGTATSLGRGVAYDSALFRPPLLMDPLTFERDREQLLRLQQQQLLAGSSVNHTATNPLASMIDLERTASRSSTLPSTASRLVAQPPVTSTLPLPVSQSNSGLFNSQLLGGLDGATAAAAAAAAASLYSTGLFQRERLDLEQQLRLLGAAGSQMLPTIPGVAPSAGMTSANADPLRLGLLNAAAGNSLMDPFFSARAALGNAALFPGFSGNLGLNFGLTPGTGAPTLNSNHLPASSTAAVGSLMQNNMISPFSNSLEQLARQKRDVLLASAAAAAATGPTANVFQNR